MCVCDAGWLGDSCEGGDAPEAADTVLWLDASDRTTRGMIQYLAPTLQLRCAVLL